MVQKKYAIDMWNDNRFKSGKYHADAFFYPHGSAGFCYRGNIYNDTGVIVGDYASNCSMWIDNNFKIVWR